MNIQVIVKSVYGKPAIYPHNDHAKVLAELIGKKTFNMRDLELARDLGHRIEEVSILTIPDHQRAPQPVASVPDTTYVLTEGQLVRLFQGRPSWSMDCAVLFEMFETLRHWARLDTEGEVDDMSGDDACSTVSMIISQARQLVAKLAAQS